MIKENIEINKAEVSDAEAIFSIHKNTWIQTYPNRKLGITKKLLENLFINKKARIVKWQKQIKAQDDNNCIWILKYKQEIIGFGVAKKEKVFNYLRAIYLLPKFQRKGLGKKFLIQMLKWLGKEKSVLIEVANYNTSAINFYKKSGFQYRQEVVSPKSGNLLNGKTIPQIEMIKSNEI
jgi:ribosomal protein S18 acetylase RimI-like enzyme